MLQALHLQDAARLQRRGHASQERILLCLPLPLELKVVPAGGVGQANTTLEFA